MEEGFIVVQFPMGQSIMGTGCCNGSHLCGAGAEWHSDCKGPGQGVVPKNNSVVYQQEPTTDVLPAPSRAILL